MALAALTRKHWRASMRFGANLRRSDGSRVAQWRLLLVLMPSTRFEAGLM